MRITKISVKGLFGMFDHEIPLNQESRITIMHGPNGVGKTVLMQMVHGLFRNEYQWLGSIPFDLLRIEFDSREFVIVEKVKAAERLFIEYIDNNGIKHDVPYVPPANSNLDEILMSAIENELPDYKQFSFGGTSYWVDDFSPRFPSIRETLEIRASGDVDAIEAHERKVESLRSEIRFDLLTEYEVLEKHPQIHDKVFGEIPEWFARIRKEANIRLIQVQRLRFDAMDKDDIEAMKESINYDEGIYIPESRETVTDFSLKSKEELRRKIIGAYEAMSGKEFDERVEELREHLESYDDFREELQRIGGPAMTSEIEKYLLRDIVEELEATLERDDLLKEKEVFEDIINARILFKLLTIDTDEGFKITDRTGRAIKESQLSSGEQQLLVLYYQLLFEIEPDTLVMIDEPELSMNVVWQRNFLKDLQRIIELREFDVLIATHSPQIIHDKWDWMVPLGEKVDD